MVWPSIHRARRSGVVRHCKATRQGCRALHAPGQAVDRRDAGLGIEGDEPGHGERGEDAEDGDDHHQFDQRESTLERRLHLQLQGAFAPECESIRESFSRSHDVKSAWRAASLSEMPAL
jgi:hypothetical protein